MTELTAQTMAQDQEHLWHPFTQMQSWLCGDQLAIASGQGALLYDTEGREYIDGVSSLWVNVHGHCHPTINRAITTQLEQIAHSTMLGLANVPASQLAAKLMQLVPSNLKRVFYSDSGSEGCEIALKLAFQYQQQTGQTERTRFLALKNSYHGDTLGAVSVGGIGLFHSKYRPLLFDTSFIPSPYCYRCPYGQQVEGCNLHCLEQAEQIMAPGAHQFAALIAEPMVQGACGMITSPPGYLRGLRALCDKYGILLILDEVATGFGRTGQMFATAIEQVEPDIMVTAKGISGGYLPLAATFTTAQIFAAFLGEQSEHKTFFHGHSYTGNQLACAAAIGSLQVFDDEDTMQNLQPKIAYLAERLTQIAKLAAVGDIRQCGFMVGIELVADKATKKPFDPTAQTGAQICRKARDMGLIIRPLGDLLVLMPHLNIPDELLAKTLDIVTQLIAEI